MAADDILFDVEEAVSLFQVATPQPVDGIDILQEKNINKFSLVTGLEEKPKIDK